MSQANAFYRAMLARDPRFDGKFFYAVKTTGIYCRPVCPARPKRENVEFFATAERAEKAGYRACRRCRPDSAPFSPAWRGKSAVVQRALRSIAAGRWVAHGLETDEERFAEQFGVSARHLRRLFKEEVGRTPKQLLDDQRLESARKLVTGSLRPMTEIAEAAGFKSVRRFNDAFRKRFGHSPTRLREGRNSK
jgi:AraC family transcriptional regulator of adaptative response / DNA-3-methyladenine glycosylase II